ncbi:MAG: hypothetical protein U5K30_02490 [Acidimicrobiales bacterium]|nr:hypothetical protein [Acidimicrobiales bacterium]
MMRTVGHGDRGQVAGIEVLPFGLLVFIAGALLLTNIWAVVDTKFAADAAAREATRYVVESARADADTGAIRARANVVANHTMQDHGRPSELDVTLSTEDGSLDRCRRVVVRVATEIPAVRIPFVGGFGEPFDVVATHSELIDPTRSGVGGRADCIR